MSMSSMRTTPDETVLLYATVSDRPIGHGRPIVHRGHAATFPSVTIGGLPAFVMYAGVSAPGLYQLNVAIPLAAPNGDLTVSPPITAIAPSRAS
jgi:uncharacterized protein (TIGR03437 family)